MEMQSTNKSSSIIFNTVREACKQTATDPTTEMYWLNTLQDILQKSSLPQDFKKKDEDGRTPLHIACLDYKDTLVLNKGVKIETYVQSERLLKLLLDQTYEGQDTPVFDVNAVDNEGKTPLDYANEHGLTEHIQLLERYGGISLNVLNKYEGDTDQLSVYTKDEQIAQVSRYLKILKGFTGAYTVKAVGDFLLKKDEDDKHLESKERKEKQFEWILGQDFDFFGLQEFDTKMNTAYNVKKTDKYDIILGPEKKLDVAILYNKSWKIIDDTRKEFKAGVAQDFKKEFEKEGKKEEKQVTVVCAHLKSGSSEDDRKKRIGQAKDIMKYISDKTNVIICVDANDTEGAMLFTNPDLFTTPDGPGKDDDISKKTTDDPCIPNYDPDNLEKVGTWTSDHYALCAKLDNYKLDNPDTLINIKSEVRNKEGVTQYASTNKCRGASSEQLGKIGEWVSGTIDFILAKNNVAGITAWSWNLLNRADGFLLPGDPLEEKDDNLDSLITIFKEVEEAAGKSKKEELLAKENKKKVEEMFNERDGEYYHWEQEVIRLAHFYAKKIAEQIAKRWKKHYDQVNEQKSVLTQGIIPFGRQPVRKLGFNLRF